MEDENQTYKRVAVLIAFVVLVAAGFVWHGRIANDFWPPDRSFVGPNLLASIIQSAVVLFVAALIWPPTRKRIHDFVEKKLKPIHDAVKEQHGRAEKHREEIHAESSAQRLSIEQKLDHIIKHHPDIPTFKRKTK